MKRSKNKNNYIQSKESSVIEQLLTENYYYTVEYTFDKLHGKRNIPLRFDFAVFSDKRKKKLLFLIEYDSIIHFRRTAYFHRTLTSYLQARERDRRKNRFCLANDIKLIRIPYWELENLTLDKIINYNGFVVKSEWHNDYVYRKKMESEK